MAHAAARSSQRPTSRRSLEVSVRDVCATLSERNDHVPLCVPLALAQQVARRRGGHRWVLVVDRTERAGEAADRNPG